MDDVAIASPVRRRPKRPAGPNAVVFGQMDVAERYHIPETTLEKYRSLGGGPPFHKLGARVVYLKDEVDAWFFNLPRFERTTPNKRGRPRKSPQPNAG